MISSNSEDMLHNYFLPALDFLGNWLHITPSLLKLSKLVSSRDNVVLHEETQDLILRFSLTKNLGDVQNETLFMKYLAEKDFPCPTPLYVGTLVIRSKEFPVALFRYLPHAQMVYAQRPNKQRIMQAAEVLAQLHSFSVEFMKHQSFHQHRGLATSLEKLQSTLLDPAGVQFGKNTKGRDKLLTDLRWALEFVSAYPQQPHDYILHNDYRYNNVLFNSAGKLVGVIDFDWAIPSRFPQKDIAHAALEWSYPENGKFNAKLYDQFISSYCKSADYSPFKDTTEAHKWTMFSALSDAAHYFLSYPGRCKFGFSSYMYDKYNYFQREI